MLIKKLVWSFSTIFVLSGCSVVMSAKKSGVSVEQLGECRTRTCIISKGAIPVSAKKDSKGNLIAETYQAKKPTGSAARSVMHGILDLTTLGIWEAAGTPIEGSMTKADYYAIKVFYQNDGETVKSIQLG